MSDTPVPEDRPEPADAADTTETVTDVPDLTDADGATKATEAGEATEATEAGEAGEAGEASELTDADETTDGEPVTAPPVPPGGPRRVLAWCRQRWVAVLTAGLLLLSTLSAGSVYWWLYRPDRLTDEQAQQVVLAAATEGTEALLSYSPESVEQNVADAKNLLTGEFLTRYGEFADSVVTPAAKERGIKTEANVARSAVAAMRPDEARVLVFVNQVTTSTERPTPALATSSVIVTLVRDGDRWLISEFTPI